MQLQTASNHSAVLCGYNAALIQQLNPDHFGQQHFWIWCSNPKEYGDYDNMN